MGTRKDIIVLDNGGATIKVGFAGDDHPVCVVPNCVAKPRGEKRSYVCDEIDNIKDISSLNLRRPVDRGYVVNWDLQKDIWDHVFRKVLKIKPKECHLVLTEAPFNLPAIMSEQDDVIFDHFGFKSALICNPASLVLAHHFKENPDGVHAKARCGVVLDVGFSFAHATPTFDGRVLRKGTRRVNLGGKALTNYLKELVSYRQWNMMDEYALVDDVKEKLCYVAADVAAELQRARARGAANRINRQYVLPDGVRVLRGFVRSGAEQDTDADADDSDEDDEDEEDPGGGGGSKRKKKKTARGGGGGGKRRRASGVGAEGAGGVGEQCLGMGNERFMVPEALFHPSDIGLTQAGIAEAVAQAVNAVQRDLRGLMYGNVVLAGGDRLEADLRPLVPAEDALTVTAADDPVTTAWRGGSVVGAGPDFARLAVTKEEYKRDRAEIKQRYDEHAAVVRGRM